MSGARVISIDASNQVILASGRATAVGAEHVLTKVYNLKFVPCQMDCGPCSCHLYYIYITHFIVFFYANRLSCFAT